MENQVIEKELESSALTLKEQAASMVINDLTSFASAGELGKNIKELRAKIVEYFKPIKEAAHQAHKAITAKESSELKPVDEAIAILRDTMNAFTREQERIRQEEERKRQKEEEEKAEKERQKLLAQAIKAEEKGKDEKAEELLEQAENIYVAPVTVAPTIAKTVATASGNVTQAVDYIISVTDIKAFIAALVAKNIAPTMLEVKQAPLKAWVKANGLDQFPGISINKTTSVRF